MSMDTIVIVPNLNMVYMHKARTGMKEGQYFSSQNPKALRGLNPKKVILLNASMLAGKNAGELIATIEIFKALGAEIEYQTLDELYGVNRYGNE